MVLARVRRPVLPQGNAKLLRLGVTTGHVAVVRTARTVPPTVAVVVEMDLARADTGRIAAPAPLIAAAVPARNAAAVVYASALRTAQAVNVVTTNAAGPADDAELVRTVMIEQDSVNAFLTAEAVNAETMAAEILAGSVGTGFRARDIAASKTSA